MILRLRIWLQKSIKNGQNISSFLKKMRAELHILCCRHPASPIRSVENRPAVSTLCPGLVDVVFGCVDVGPVNVSLVNIVTRYLPCTYFP